MARTAHRTVILSAALAFASWALVAGAPVLAATQTGQAGPSLPPAEYRPLPVGTVVTYDTWSYTVTKSDGYDIRFKTDAGNWKKYYAVFGKHGSNVYLSGEWADSAVSASSYEGQDWESDLDAESKAALETMWPLRVGKKVKLNSEELKSGYSGFPTTRPWTVALEVVRAEILELNGVLYSTYVIEEHALSEGVSGPYASAGPEGYSETKWYNPESGLVLKSVKEMTRGPMKGGWKEYSLVRVRFPQGTKTHVLAATKAPPPAPAVVAAANRRGGGGPREGPGIGAQLATLEGLLRNGLISSQEFEKRKRALLDRVFGTPDSSGDSGAKPSAQVAAVQRAGDATPANIPNVQFGRYHALVIGIGNYKHLPRLKTAVNDAKVVAEVLRRDYGFEVSLLLDPSRNTIIDALDTYREKLGERDNLLIYYAGHGWLDEEVDRGYWLPVDATRNRRSNWVSNATISDTLKGLRAKHVMVVADSCFSGSLVRGAKVELRSGDYWQRMAQKRTRVVLTSGGLEPVEDNTGGGHSPFAKAFIAALRGNTAIIDGTRLFSQIRRPVMLSTNQTPEYSDLRNAGHDGGDFLFVRRR